jgi:hypothetical protein
MQNSQCSGKAMRSLETSFYFSNLEHQNQPCLAGP